MPAPTDSPKPPGRGLGPTLTVSQAPAAARPHSPLRAPLPLPAPASARGSTAPSRDAAVGGRDSTRPRGLAALAPNSQALGDLPAPLGSGPQRWRSLPGGPGSSLGPRPSPRRAVVHVGPRGRIGARPRVRPEAGSGPKGGTHRTARLGPLRRGGPAVPASLFLRAERTGIVRPGPGRALETKAVGAPGQRKAGATPLAREKQTTHSALGLCGFFESLGATPQPARACRAVSGKIPAILGGGV